MFCRNVRFALGSSAALVLLAACSGGGSPTSNPGALPLSQSQLVRQSAAGAPIMNSATGRIGLPVGFHGVISGVRETSPGWLSEDAKKPIPKVFVSDNAANAVYIYNAKSPTAPIGTITNGINGPVGNFVDASGNLYVTNNNTSTVTVYAKGHTTPSKTYTAGLQQPTAVAVGKDGTVYVAAFQSGLVVEYDKGATTPSRTLGLSEAEGVALDSKNNLYVSYIDPFTNQGAVQEFKPKATTGTNLGIAVQFAGDLKLDKQNDLLLEDQLGQTVNFYKPGATAPYGAIAVGNGAFRLALNSTETLAYVATASTSVAIFDAKPSGMSVGTISSGLQSAYGVSLSPPAPL